MDLVLSHFHFIPNVVGRVKNIRDYLWLCTDFFFGVGKTVPSFLPILSIHESHERSGRHVSKSAMKSSHLPNDVSGKISLL